MFIHVPFDEVKLKAVEQDAIPFDVPEALQGSGINDCSSFDGFCIFTPHFAKAIRDDAFHEVVDFVIFDQNTFSKLQPILIDGR